MSILELKKVDLSDLSDTQLEELVARLSEAEVAERGGRLRDVMWSGSITAPDGGIDVRVSIANENFEGDFIPCFDTVFQAKAKAMPRAEILKEMKDGKEPSAIVKELAEANGAYVIVSTEDCSPPMYTRRTEAMREVVRSLPSAGSLYLDFYDRSRLHQWLRQHPSVQIWLRGKLGQPLSGWRGFERWSSTPAGSDDTLILEEGLTVTVSSTGINYAALEEAILNVRRLITISGKPIRVIGLSGVGKSRFVQALFEEDIGEEALDRSSVIYADIGDQPEPSANAMIDTLLAQKSSLTVVLDNCASDLHNALSARLRGKENSLRLITIEYDIREDKPQTTEVVQIEAHGPKITEKLLLRRYPELGQFNAAKIAELSEGNARLALAIAESAPIDDTLAGLTDEQLFNRLFYQRHEFDAALKQQAETLSLVYSFSVEKDEEGVDELGILGVLCDHNRIRMHRAAQTLVERQVAQQRSRWRAVLPHAVANRLAAEALNNIPFDLLVEVFEHRARTRLLKSFGRRLGFLHEHPVAVEIMKRWTSDGGLLSDLTQLNDDNLELFRHIAPVSPDLTLDLLERTLTRAEVLQDLGARRSFRSIVLNLLVALAYYPEHFERAVEILLKIAEHEDPENKYDSVRGKLEVLFQAFLSGTHASLEQRAAIVNACFWSNSSTRQAIGFKLLDSALEGNHWTGAGTIELGARPRDFGYRPNFSERLEWLRRFLGIALAVANSGKHDLVSNARHLVANRFRGLWRYPDLRPDLAVIAAEINADSPWLEGWHAIRSTLHYDYKKSVDHSDFNAAKTQLEQLERSLSPQDLQSEIEALVINTGHNLLPIDDEFDHESLDKYEEARQRQETKAFELGEAAAAAPDILEVIAKSLFEGNYAPYRRDFGRGLMNRASQPREIWARLVSALRMLNSNSIDYSVLIGVLDELSKSDEFLTAELLDEAASDHLLRPVIVRLHPYTGFSNADFDRCLLVLDDLAGYPGEYEVLLWRDGYRHIEYDKQVQLAENMLRKKDGDFAFLEAMMMRLHGKNQDEDVLGLKLRKLAIRAATSHFTKDDLQRGGIGDYRLTQVLRHCLPFDDCSEEKSLLLDSMFDGQSAALRHSYRYNDAVAEVVTHLTGPFLTRALLDSDVQNYLCPRGSHFKDPLDGVRTEDLLSWCRSLDNDQAWVLVANAIFPFSSSEEGEETQLTEQAKSILWEAPKPVDILKVYIDAVSPMSWSGSRANIISQRLTALASLDQARSDSVTALLNEELPGIRKVIEEESEREASQDRESEQRFE